MKTKDLWKSLEERLKTHLARVEKTKAEIEKRRLAICHSYYEESLKQMPIVILPENFASSFLGLNFFPETRNIHYEESVVKRGEEENVALRRELKFIKAKQVCIVRITERTVVRTLPDPKREFEVLLIDANYRQSNKSQLINFFHSAFDKYYGICRRYSLLGYQPNVEETHHPWLFTNGAILEAILKTGGVLEYPSILDNLDIMWKTRDHLKPWILYTPAGKVYMVNEGRNWVK
jgi:hypothetical protein